MWSPKTRIRNGRLQFSALDCPALLPALDVLLGESRCKVIGMRDAFASIFRTKGLGTDAAWHDLFANLGRSRLMPVSLEWENRHDYHESFGPGLNGACQLSLESIDDTAPDKSLFEIPAAASKLDPGTATHLR